MDTEIWKDIEGYMGKYQISNLGKLKIISFSNGKIGFKKIDRQKKKSIMKSGYEQTCLRKDNQYKHFLIHRLVAEDLRKFLNDNGEKQYPTIDPIKEIDKMIEELRSIYENQSKGSLYWLAYKSGHDTLQELKSRLYPLTQK